MLLEKFDDNHIEQAARLALTGYVEERTFVPFLPDGEYYGLFCEMLSKLTGHGLGIAAVEDGAVAGFLTCCEPFGGLFGSVTGVFSPIHAHAARKDGRRRIYSQLYQAAAEKWVKQGVLSHAVALYAHDAEAVDSFFWNGFGHRCVDAVRPVEPIACGEFPGFMFCELARDEISDAVPLKNDLIGHLRGTPMFMPLDFSFDEKGVLEEKQRRNSRYFAAKAGGNILAFMEIMASGENFACDAPGMANICGAYMLPEHRGSGVYTGLLSFLMETLAREGYSRCGVDFESFNPTARGFWLKHFTAYTYSLTRRIDERICGTG